MGNRRPAFAGQRERGSALLAVVGAVALLGGLAYAAALSASSALERAAVRSEATAAYYLALGGVEAALQRMSATLDLGQRLPRAESHWQFHLGTGHAEVTTAPEAGMVDVNRTTGDALVALLQEVGVPSDQAGPLASGVLAYRSRLRDGHPRLFADGEDSITESGESSFSRLRASIRMVEELLAVSGVTPGLIYGGFEVQSGGAGGLRHTGGLLRLLRAGGPATVDLNAAPRQVLSAAGLGPELVGQILQARRLRTIVPGDPLLRAVARQEPRIALGSGDGSTAWLMVSTGHPVGQRATRSVSAFVEVHRGSRSVAIRRWYDRRL